MNKRFTREAWIAHGLGVLRDTGHEALKADTMCKTLGVSRGSFYWHFPSLGDFHDALLEAWKAQETENVITDLKNLQEPQKQLVELIQRTKDIAQPLENAMRRWGGANEKVRAALAEADQLRCSYLVDLMVGQGIDRQVAKDRAILLVWAFIGRAFAPEFVSESSATVAEDLSALVLSQGPKDGP